MNKIIHWLGVVFTAVIIFIIFTLSFIYAANPYIAKHQQQIEQFFSAAIERPVKFEKVALGIHGIVPVIKFTNLEVDDPQTNAAWLRMGQLNVGLDLLASLFHWQFEPGFLLVKDTNLDIVKKTDNAFDVNGVTFSEEASEQNKSLQNKMLHLISQGRIIIKDSRLTFKSEKGNVFGFTNFNFDLDNEIYYRKLRTNGVLSHEEVNTTFAFNLKFRGNLIERKPLSIFGNVDISNFNFKFNGDYSEGFAFLIPFEGRLNFNMQQCNLSLENLFLQPLKIDKTEGAVDWHKSDKSWEISFSNTNVSNNELNIRGSGKLSLPFVVGQSPAVDIEAMFEGHHIENAKLYYPAKIMDKDLIGWLDKAFLGGQGISGKFVLKGRLSDFPFDNGNGTFLIDTAVHDIEFNYFADWPIMHRVNGNLLFKERSMQVKVNSANIMGAPVSYANAVIPDLANAILKVDGKVQSDSSYGINYIAKSPLKEILGEDFSGIKLSGNMALSLKMLMPIAKGSTLKTQINGVVDLQDNSLQLASWNIGLNKLQGVVRFTQDSLVAENFRGELFLRPVVINIATVLDESQNKVTEFNFTGKAAISDVDKSLKMKLSDFLSGETDYAASVKFYYGEQRQKNNLNVNSTLLGINVQLPEPLKKAASTAENLNVNFSFASQEPKLLVNYGGKLNAALSFQYLNNAMQFKSGELHFGKESASGFAGKGLFISGHISDFDWNSWSSVLHKSQVGLNKAGLVRKVDLNFDKLSAFGQTLQPVQIKGGYLGNALQVQIQSEKIAGNIALPDSYPKSPLSCNFSKVYLNMNQEEKTTSLFKPSDMSSLKFFAKELHYGDKSLGQVEFETAPDIANSGLTIKSLKVTTPTFIIESSGKWRTVGEGTRTMLDGTLTSKDFGKALKSWGMTESLVGGDGNLKFYLVWPGAFYDPGLSGSSGNLSLLIKDGRIVNLSTSANAEVGIGRVLNILGLQTLPRRLALDFSDLVKEGFIFDTLMGTYKLDNGNIYTSDTELNGSVAKINVNGRIGLKAKDFNMLLTVVPNFTSSLPVIATFVGGPITGAAAWLADKVIISKSVGKVASYVYKVTGSWVNPNVQKM